MFYTTHAATEGLSSVLPPFCPKISAQTKAVICFIFIKVGLKSLYDLEQYKRKQFDKNSSNEFTEQYDRQNKVKGTHSAAPRESTTF